MIPTERKKLHTKHLSSPACFSTNFPFAKTQMSRDHVNNVTITYETCKMKRQRAKQIIAFIIIKPRHQRISYHFY